MHYAPNGKLMCVVGTGANGPSINFMGFEIGEGTNKPSWNLVKRTNVSQPSHRSSLTLTHTGIKVVATTACFNHGGSGLALGSLRANQLMFLEYPSIKELPGPAAHVGGCSALALDPRGL